MTPLSIQDIMSTMIHEPLRVFATYNDPLDRELVQQAAATTRESALYRPNPIVEILSSPNR